MTEICVEVWGVGCDVVDMMAEENTRSVLYLSSTLNTLFNILRLLVISMF